MKVCNVCSMQFGQWIKQHGENRTPFTEYPHCSGWVTIQHEGAYGHDHDLSVIELVFCTDCWRKFRDSLKVPMKEIKTLSHFDDFQPVFKSEQKSAVKEKEKDLPSFWQYWVDTIAGSEEWDSDGNFTGDIVECSTCLKPAYKRTGPEAPGHFFSLRGSPDACECEELTKDT